MTDREDLERPRHTPQSRAEDDRDDGGETEPGATPQGRTDEEQED